MSNERLRVALHRAGLTHQRLGEQVGVDAKTVERWITSDRIPHARNRHAAARVLGEEDRWLWPAETTHLRDDLEPELVQLHIQRAKLGATEWLDMFARARQSIDVLVYAGLFLPEQIPGAVDELARKARSGTAVRVLLGDPDSPAVRVRGIEEGIGADAVALKIRNSLALLRRSLTSVPNLSVRLHGSTLYSSIYRFDDEMVVNQHVLGLPAAQAPALHLRRRGPGGLFDTYGDAYDRVWRESKPAWDEED
jgi:transcriptional regulator with XRE-family HTH domain